MSAAPTPDGPVRDTSASSGGFSHSQTGITAPVPVTAGALTTCGRCWASERHTAVARSTKPGSEEPWAGGLPSGTAMPMSSSETARCRRFPSTSQIRSGT